MKAVNKDITREIKNSRSRFLSIMVLVALATAFLSGLKATAPDMKHTGDAYFDDRRLMDIQIISTLGITAEDIAAIGEQPDIAYAEGAYVIDAWAGDNVVKAYSITDEVNKLTLLSGRMPKKADECVVDKRLSELSGISLSDSIRIAPGGDYEDCLLHDAYTVVGTVRSPYYISVERGSASIGSGSVKAYVYLPKQAFDLDQYTTAYVLAKNALEMTAFYDEYDNYIDDVIDRLEPFGERRAKLRYDSIIGEANEKIDEAQQELEDAEYEVMEEIAVAEQELADAREKLDKGWRDYRNGKKELDEAYYDLIDGQRELNEGLAELYRGEAEYRNGKREFNESEQKLNDAKKQLDEAQNSIDSYDAAVSGIAQLEGSIAEMSAGIDGLTQQLSLAPEEEKPAIEARINELQGTLMELTAQKSAIETQIASIDPTEIQAAREQLAAGTKEYNEGAAKLEAGRKELNEGWQELQDGWREYYKGRQELEDGRQEYIDGIAELPKAKKKLEDGEKEYEDGLIELEDGKKEAEGELADARKKLADARRDVADIEAGEWYMLSRDYDPGYTGFGQDADRMANLSVVFPVIFFMVAALVCLTTMTRMVDEQRTQIGLMKALGYGRFAISKKYLSYGLLPSLVGSVLGVALGHVLFPVMIYVSYQIMYEMPDISLSVYPGTSLFAAAAAIACTTLSTLWACLSTLTDTPANLMRPRAPEPGKRVLLERIGFIWKRMSFNWKVTTRNLFRYQKRFWMTVIGIGGCTALIIAGFGLRGSLLETMSKQYGELFHYDAQLTLADGLLDDERQEVDEYIASSPNITGSAYMYATSVTVKSPVYSTTAYLEAVDGGRLADMVTVRNFHTGELIPIPSEGVLIDQKLSELLNVNIGDTVTLDSDGLHDAVVAGIYENYIAHFIYLTPEYYGQIFGKAPEDNSLLLKLADSGTEAYEALSGDLLKMNGVSGASRMSDTKETYQSSMERVDFVVLVVILCAAALAVVVLYNLSNINMTERMRELATIKLIGFYDREVSAYVYRENIILTIVGIALGCLFGKYLHGWLVRSVEIDLMMFGRSTSAESYILAAGLTAVFSAFVNVLAHRKMKGINMVESLKSAE